MPLPPTTKKKTQMTFLILLWSFSSLTLFVMYIFKGCVQHEESVSHMGSKVLFLVEEGTEIWKDENLIKSFFLLVTVIAGSVVFKLWPITFLHDNNKSTRSNFFFVLQNKWNFSILTYLYLFTVKYFILVPCSVKCCCFSNQLDINIWTETIFSSF